MLRGRIPNKNSCLPKIKHFGPPKNFGLATPLF